MFEQPKLLRRPLPPKLLPELSMPKKKTYRDRIPGKHQPGVITSTNNEDRKIFPSSYFSGQTQLQPKDAHLLPDQSSTGQTQVQLKDAHGLLDQNIKKDSTLTSYRCAPASCQLQKDGRSSDAEVLAPPGKSDSVYWSFPDIATMTSPTDKDKITLSGYFSHSQTSVRLKVQNLLPDQILKKDFITTTTPSGPPGFPLHKHRKPFHVQLLGLQKDEPAYFTLPEFTTESLAAESSFHPSPLMSPFRMPVFSRCNYQKLTSQLPSEVRKNIQTEVNTVVLSSNDEFPVISPRKPVRQTIIETALEEKMRKASSPEQILEDVEGKRSVIDNLKLYTHEQKKPVSYAESDHALDGNTIKGVQGFGYQTLSEQDEQEELMARSRMAVMFCAMYRRTELSLKAYFLTLLPDLTPLVNTLVYLNLSFNDLHFFPREVYNIKHLEVLKLRNNPIREIPDDVHKLKTLRILNMSFNLISSLPTGLFSLPYLSSLELAYNDISVIPHEIRNLRALEYLNVEGNQLCALPCEVLDLPLKYLNTENNFMHPFLWKENSQNQPQRLADLAALCFSRNNMWQRYPEISKDIQEILNNFTVCDCCKGPLYGQGLRLIRSCRNIFRFRRLPFLFNACSPSCYSSFMSQTDSVTRVLYGN